MWNVSQIVSRSDTPTRTDSNNASSSATSSAFAFGLNGANRNPDIGSPIGETMIDSCKAAGNHHDSLLQLPIEINTGSGKALNK